MNNNRNKIEDKLFRQLSCRVETLVQRGKRHPWIKTVKVEFWIKTKIIKLVSMGERTFFLLHLIIVNGRKSGQEECYPTIDYNCVSAYVCATPLITTLAMWLNLCVMMIECRNKGRGEGFGCCCCCLPLVCCFIRCDLMRWEMNRFVVVVVVRRDEFGRLYQANRTPNRTTPPQISRGPCKYF